MYFLVAICLFVIFVLFLEKPSYLAFILNNIGDLKNWIKPIMISMFLILLLFYTHDISDFIQYKTNYDTKQATLKKKWWNDTNKRDKFIKNKLKRFNNTSRKRVAVNQHWKCLMCHNLLDESYDIDFSVSLFDGGDNTITNLHALCSRCKKKKGLIQNKL